MGRRGVQRFCSTVSSLASTGGTVETSVPGTLCVGIPSVSPLSNRRWRACLAMVAEGAKELVLGNTSHLLDRWRYTLTPVALPMTSRVAQAPFACLLVELDPLILGRITAAMDERNETPGDLQQAFFVGEMTTPMREAAARLSDQLSSREAGAVLGPGLVRELLFHVLCGPNGPGLRQFVRAGSEAHRIGRAVHQIESRLASPLEIESLASEARMSRTLFFEHFKRVTSLSPVQFQKRLRLLEAQRLLTVEQTSAEDAAYRVGYQSPSQFSREYARMFGEPPIKNAVRIRRSVRLATRQS